MYILARVNTKMRNVKLFKEMTFRSQQLFIHIFLSPFVSPSLFRSGPSNIVGSDLHWRPHLHTYMTRSYCSCVELFVHLLTCKMFWVVFVLRHNSKLCVSLLIPLYIYFCSTSVENWLKHNHTTRFVSNPDMHTGLHKNTVTNSYQGSFSNDNKF